MVGIFLFLLFLFFCAALIGAHELSKNTPAGAWSKKTGAESDLADPSEFKGALAHNCLCHATIFFVLFFSVYYSNMWKIPYPVTPNLMAIISIKEDEIQAITVMSLPSISLFSH